MNLYWIREERAYRVVTWTETSASAMGGRLAFKPVILDSPLQAHPATGIGTLVEADSAPEALAIRDADLRDIEDSARRRGVLFDYWTSLGLRPSTAAIFSRAGLGLPEVLRLTDAELRHLRGLGAVRLHEVRTLLEEHNPMESTRNSNGGRA